MGLFSWQCKKCEHSIKSPYNLPTGWEYMNEAVYVRRDEKPIIGEYDGYGRIMTEDGKEYDMQNDVGFDDDPELWHKVCWENSGKPGYTSTSEYASDQGFFYDDPSEEELLEAIHATE